jgi:hypothetical protein
MSLLPVAAVLATSAWKPQAPIAGVSLTGLPLTRWLRIAGTTSRARTAVNASAQSQKRRAPRKPPARWRETLDYPGITVDAARNLSGAGRLPPGALATESARPLRPAGPLRSALPPAS